MISEAEESKLKKRMDDLHRNIDTMKGNQFRLNDINLTYMKKELLTDNFMNENTKFSNFNNMLKSDDFKIENEIEFEDISKSAEWNQYISKNTQFKDWNEMLRTAVLERATRKLRIKK